MVEQPRLSETLLWLPDVANYQLTPPALDDCSGVVSGPVVGDDHLERPISLLRERAENDVESQAGHSYVATTTVMSCTRIIERNSPLRH